MLVSREHGLPYHKGYYDEFRQRAEDLIVAQYSEDPSDVLAFTQTYDIDFWLVDKISFQPSYLSNWEWAWQFQPMANEADQSLQEGANPVLQQSINTCSVLDAAGWNILDANCVYEFASQLE